MKKSVAIIGGGPAGLMAAEHLAGNGHVVTVYDAMPTVGRKFLLAGKSGLNITHAEDYARFVTRYGAANDRLRSVLDLMTPEAIRVWADDLGTETFVGSSGRVFPKVMKASPLLRAWVKRLEATGVTILTRHRWTGFDGDALLFERPEGQKHVIADATLLALGGASWPKLGSDAAWVPLLEAEGVDITQLRPANCGFDCDFSESFNTRFSGQPVKSVKATSAAGTTQGEFVISKGGIEGSLIYAHAAALRDALDRDGHGELILDLTPGRTTEKLATDFALQDRKASFSTRLKKAANLDGVKIALIREVTPEANRLDLTELAKCIKALPLAVKRPRPIAEAISTAGGVSLNAIDAHFMLTSRPGTFVAGEMLDWEAPTGGYLLTACFATGIAAAEGINRWLETPND
ncbi:MULTISPECIES: TIGR03862 family flavoprotein [unclassified Agrobacterium]|uniref:TIGR03862 family flavoprotein n=1 Tax=unclassified Agrobacterium TaxID=2632611 RepID=UPI00083D76D5|nr:MULTISPECIES: TIGR03862 family flavoprotein [unclassified Agrobacterium]AOG12348.1 flavo, family protein [Agrobacterium sp. RAC06]QGG91762.1 TIGR03862 family flavoprotein [Agrobacterium sp. MA01]